MSQEPPSKRRKTISPACPAYTLTLPESVIQQDTWRFITDVQSARVRKILKGQKDASVVISDPQHCCHSQGEELVSLPWWLAEVCDEQLLLFSRLCSEHFDAMGTWFYPRNEHFSGPLSQRVGRYTSRLCKPVTDQAHAMVLSGLTTPQSRNGFLRYFLHGNVVQGVVYNTPESADWFKRRVNTLLRWLDPWLPGETAKLVLEYTLSLEGDNGLQIMLTALW